MRPRDGYDWVLKQDNNNPPQWYYWAQIRRLKVYEIANNMPLAYYRLLAEADRKKDSPFLPHKEEIAALPEKDTDLQKAMEGLDLDAQ